MDNGKLTRKYSRRCVLKAAAAGAATVTLPTIVPSGAIGLAGAVAPSNRITMGFIGCGGRMNAVMGALLRVRDVQAVAVCDVNSFNREAARKKARVPASNSYVDFRDLVARDDIDAVAIASGDWWHVLQAQAAVRAGKDVYCEKPLSNTVAEGRALVRAVERYGAVFQHGTQLHSLGTVRLACELVRNGRLGKLHTIKIGSPPGQATGHHPATPVPDWIDYDLWQGPAPEAPFTTRRVGYNKGKRMGHPGWYFISDYSRAGWIAGFAVHDLDIAQWGMGNNRSGPISVEGRGVYPTKGLYDTILTFNIEYRYANGVKLILTDTGQNPHGVRFIGEKGWVFVRSRIDANPKSLLRERFDPGEIHLDRSPGHEINFIDCVKSRAPTVTPIEVAHRATSTALIGGIACELQRKLEWDPVAERFVNDDQANGLLTYAMRPPWRL